MWNVRLLVLSNVLLIARRIAFLLWSFAGHGATSQRGKAMRLATQLIWNDSHAGVVPNSPDSLAEARNVVTGLWCLNRTALGSERYPAEEDPTFSGTIPWSFLRVCVRTELG
jgi:hypothetical protein